MKEQTIDLTKTQIVDPPVECWGRNNEKGAWVKGILFSIETRYSGKALYHMLIDEEYYTMFYYCSLTDPNKPKERLMTRDEVLGFISNNSKGMLVSFDGVLWGIPTRWIYSDDDISKHQYKIVDENGKTIQEPRKFMKELK